MIFYFRRATSATTRSISIYCVKIATDLLFSRVKETENVERF